MYIKKYQVIVAVIAAVSVVGLAQPSSADVSIEWAFPVLSSMITKAVDNWKSELKEKRENLKGRSCVPEKYELLDAEVLKLGEQRLKGGLFITCNLPIGESETEKE